MPFLSKPFLKTRGPELAILLLALLFRFVLLALKPPHFDEGVNGWFVDQMAQQGYFKYDPANYHGPLHFYVLFVALELFGRNLWAMRVPIALVSLAAVALVLCFQRFLGRRVCLWAGLAMAVSPGFVFYGRYAIHESWLVVFLLLTTWGLFALHREGSRAGLHALVLGVTGIILTKETYIIHVACFGLAWMVWRIWNALTGAEVPKAVPQQWTWRDAALVSGLSAVLLLFFYTGNFLLPWGDSLQNMVRTFAEWRDTGNKGNGHEKTAYDLHLWARFHTTDAEGKPHLITWFNYYWLALIWRYEWPAVAALLGIIFAFWRRGNAAMRFLAIYGLGALAAYTIVPYKTPWCLISLLWPLLFLFGYGVDAVQRLGRPWIAGTLAGLLFLASSAWSVRLNFFHETDEQEPYVYVQTFPAVYQLVNPLLELARRDPANYHLAGTFLVSSYYPLPWMLGDFDKIAYWGLHDFNGPFDANFLLVEQSRVEEVKAKLTESYFVETIKIRASQESCTVFFSYAKFHPLFPGRAPELHPERSGIE